MTNIPVKVLFIAGYGPIVRDPAASAALYRDALNLPLTPMKNNPTYLHGDIDGVKHFALWPLSQAAESCFGKPEWPADVATPSSWLEFDVEDVAAASVELQAKGYTLLVNNRTEPWGQVVTRLMSPEGILVGVTFTPWLREKK